MTDNGNTTAGTVRPFYGWKLLAALWAILIMHMAFPFFGSSVINAWMAADFGLDRRMLGMPFTVFILMMGLPGPLVALYINRTSIRCTLMTGSLLILTGSVIMATQVTTGIQAVLVFGIIIGLGTACGGPLAVQTAISRWFVRKRSLALAIVLSAPGIGGFIAARVLNHVITAADGNWRIGWWVIAALACLSMLITMLLVRESPASVGQRPDGQLREADTAGGNTDPRAPGRVYRTPVEWTFRQVLRSPVFWLILLCALGYNPGFMLMLAHGVVHLQDLGHSPAAAAGALSLMSFFTLVGNFFTGVLGDRIEPVRLWMGTMLLCAAALLLVTHADSVMVMNLFAICMGFGFGGSVICMMSLAGNYYGTRVYPFVVGVVLAVQTTVGACMPLLAGTVYDKIGTYAPVFYSLAGWGVCCTVLLQFIKPAVPPAVAGKPAA